MYRNQFGRVANGFCDVVLIKYLLVNVVTVEPKISQYQSFLLRLWQEQEVGRTTWHGEIESIQTGQKWSFADLEKLFVFLERRASHQQALQSGREK